MGRHKKVVCEKCMRVMRQDYLKKHMKKHENVKFQEPLFSNPTSLKNDPESNSEIMKTFLNEEAIIKTLKMDDAEYKNTLE